jgi:hypothetical protein
MEIDFEENNLKTIKNNNLDLEAFRSYFNNLKHKISDNKSLIIYKDPKYKFLYLFSNPLLIINNITYEIIKKVALLDNIRVEESNRILSFTMNNENHLLIYERNTIYVFPLKSSAPYNIHSEDRLTFLRENEFLINMYFLSNEVNIYYINIFIFLGLFNFFSFSYFV